MYFGIFVRNLVRQFGIMPSLIAIAVFPHIAFAQDIAQPTVPAEMADQIRMLDNDAMASYALGDYAEALDLFAHALRLRRESLGETNRDTITNLNNYAFMLNALGRASEAEPVFAEALRLRREILGETHPDTLAGLSNYASVLEALGRAVEAEPIHAEALRARRAVLGDRNPDTLISLNNYAAVLNALGRVSEAEPYFAEALRLRREVLGETHPDTIATMSNHAAILNALGRASEAEPVLAEALRLRRKVLGTTHPATISSLNEYASVLRSLGRSSEAEPIFVEALRFRREILGETHPDTIASLNNYASVLLELGRAQEAEPIFAEALRLRRLILGETHPETINSLNNYAGVLGELGRLEDAKPLYAEALRLNREVLGEKHPETIASLNNYAGVLSDLGRTVEAEPVFAEALRLSRKFLGETHPNTLVTLNNYAAILTDLDRAAEAEPIYAQTLRQRRELFGESHPQTMMSALSLANIRLLAGAKLDEALEPARIGLRFWVDRSAYLTSGDIASTGQSAREKERLQRANQIFASAAWYYSDGNSSELAALRTDAFSSLQVASAGFTSQTIALQAAARYAAERDLGGLIRERRSLIDTWHRIESQLVSAQAGGAAQDAQRNGLSHELLAVETRVKEIDQTLGQQAPRYFSIVNQPALDLTMAQGLFHDDEAALLLVPTAYGTHVMVISSEGLSWNLVNVDAQEMSDRIDGLRASLEVGPNGELGEFDRQAAYYLYRQLIAPVAKALAGKAQLYIVADGSLSQLPLGVLVTDKPEDGFNGSSASDLRSTSWFADQFALVQIPSLQALAYLRTYAASPKNQQDKMAAGGYIGFGDPLLSGHSVTRGARNALVQPIAVASLVNLKTGANGALLMEPEAIRALSRLAGTKAEVEGVVAALTASSKQVFLESNMTETAMRSTDFSDTAILHLATHGLTALESGSLAEPGLVFTPPQVSSAEDDGYLSASEVVGLNLGATKWVILSACNTAAPSGTNGTEGFSGLARSFFYAGAPTLLVSHWPVYDDVAARLVVETLRRSEAGESRAQALQSAMRTIRQDLKMEAEHPAVWAPFVLVGDGR